MASTGSSSTTTPDEMPTIDVSPSSATDTNDEAPSPGRKYERKNKRFSWPDELHREFVGAIFELGMSHATTKELLPFMLPALQDAGYSTDQLRNYLYAFRANETASRHEFLALYDESASRNGRRRRRSAKSPHRHTRFIFPVSPTTEQILAAQNAAARRVAHVPQAIPVNSTPSYPPAPPSASTLAPYEASTPMETLNPNVLYMAALQEQRRAMLRRHIQLAASQHIVNMMTTAAGMATPADAMCSRAADQLLAENDNDVDGLTGVPASLLDSKYQPAITVQPDAMPMVMDDAQCWSPTDPHDLLSFVKSMN